MAEERLSVPAGALALALSASAVVVVWPPTGGGFGYYYQPTIARVGMVVAAAVGAVAVIAVVRALRGDHGQEWLWATVMLGLPAGWLGPFDTADLRLLAESPVPHFGRLAQVVLATSLVTATAMWLVRRPDQGSAVAPDPRPLARAGAWTLGSGLGLGLFAVLAGLDVMALGDPGVGHGGALPGVVAILAVVGLCSCGGPTGVTVRTVLSIVAGGTAAGLAIAGVVAAYDNNWSLDGWTDLPRTMSLVATVAVLPLAACAAAAAQLLFSGRRGWPLRPGPVRAWVVLALSLGWLSYATLPYALSWGPLPPILVAECVVVALRRQTEPGEARLS